MADEPARAANPGLAADLAAGETARGRRALAAGDLATAQAAFSAALRRNPNAAEPAIGLAETYLSLGDLGAAARLFDSVSSATSGPVEARLLQGRGLVALRQGRADEAAGLLRRSVDSDPSLWRAWLGLGRAHALDGDRRAARSAFARAEREAPARASVINDIGMTYLSAQEPATALEHFQRALSLEPDHPVARANARIARAMLGQYDAAVSGAGQVELPDVLNNVGYIAIMNEDYAVADRLLRRAVEVSPVFHEAASANLELLAQAAATGSRIAMPSSPAAGQRARSDAGEAQPPRKTVAHRAEPAQTPGSAPTSWAAVADWPAVPARSTSRPEAAEVPEDRNAAFDLPEDAAGWRDLAAPGAVPSPQSLRVDADKAPTGSWEPPVANDAGRMENGFRWVR